MGMLSAPGARCFVPYRSIRVCSQSVPTKHTDYLKRWTRPSWNSKITGSFPATVVIVMWYKEYIPVQFNLVPVETKDRRSFWQANSTLLGLIMQYVSWFFMFCVRSGQRNMEWTEKHKSKVVTFYMQIQYNYVTLFHAVWTLLPVFLYCTSAILSGSKFCFNMLPTVPLRRSINV
jgi:hypothetical protein